MNEKHLSPKRFAIIPLLSMFFGLIVITSIYIVLWINDYTPANITSLSLTNISSGTVTATFTTDTHAEMCAIVLPKGEDASTYITGSDCLFDDRSSFENKLRRTHHISASGLDSEKQYTIHLYHKASPVYVKIFDVDTATVGEFEDINEPHTIFGRLLDESRENVQDGVVLVRLGTDEAESLPLSGHIFDGHWSLDIALARNQDGTPYEISEETYSHITFITGDETRHSMNVKYGYDRPVGQVVIKAETEGVVAGAATKTFAQLPPIDLPEIDLPEIDLPDIDLPDTDIDDIELPDIDLDDMDLNLDELDDLVDLDAGLSLEPLPSIDPIMVDLIPESSILNNPDLLENLTEDLNLSSSLGDFSSYILGLSGNLNNDTANILGDIDFSIGEITLDNFDSFSIHLNDLTPELVFDFNILTSINIDIVNNITVDNVILLPELESLAGTYLGYDGDLPNASFSAISLQSLFDVVGNSGALNASEALSTILGLVTQGGNSEIVGLLFQTLSGFVAGNNSGIVGQLLGLLTQNPEIINSLISIISQDGSVGDTIIDLAMRYAAPVVEQFLDVLGLGLPGGGGSTPAPEPDPAAIAPCCCYGTTIWDENSCTNCSQSDSRWERGACEGSLSPCCCNGKTLYNENGCRNCSQSDPRWGRGTCATDTLSSPFTSPAPVSGGTGQCVCRTSGTATGEVNDFNAALKSAQEQGIGLEDILQAAKGGPVQKKFSATRSYTTTQAECTAAFCQSKAQEVCSSDPNCTSLTSSSTATWNGPTSQTPDSGQTAHIALMSKAFAATTTAEHGSFYVDSPGRYSVTIGETMTFHDVFNDAGGNIFLFDDTDNDGYMDDDEFYIGDTIENVAYEKTADIQRIHLSQGLNFVGFNVFPTNITTSDALAALFARQGAQIFSISEFRSGRWNTHVIFGAEDYSTPLTLEEGRGYVINAKLPADIVIYGTASTLNTLEGLPTGWNLIGIPSHTLGDYYVDIADVADDHLRGYPDVSFFTWQKETQRFDGYLIKEGEIYGNPFFVTSDRSYFVGIE